LLRDYLQKEASKSKHKKKNLFRRQPKSKNYLQHINE